MGGGYHLNPLVGADAAGRNEVPKLLVQDLGGGPGEAANPRFFEGLQVVPDAALGACGAVKYLLGGEAVDMDVG